MLRFIPFAAVAILANPANAQLAPVAEPALVSAAQACMGLPPDAEAGRLLLTQRGWKRGEIKDDKGKPIADTRVEAWGKDGVVLLFGTESKNVGCLIMAGAPADMKIGRLIDTISGAVGRDPLGKGADGAVWSLPQSQAFMLMVKKDGSKATVHLIVSSTQAAKK